MFGFAGFGPSNASVTALKLVMGGTRCIHLTYNATQHRDAVASRPDVAGAAAPAASSTAAVHRGGRAELLLARGLAPGQAAWW